MRILIDECLPRHILRCLTGHDAQTVQQAGYGGYANGELLKLAESEFDLFISADKNLRYQQNLADRKLAILILSTNDLNEILQNGNRIREIVERMKDAEFIELEL
jgi:predicted nuclease of predicted toxin-antitoxin system